MWRAACGLERPKAQGDGFKRLPDEQELWDQSRDEEKQLLEKVTLYHDPLLETYLDGVVTRLNTKGMAANPSSHYTLHRELGLYLHDQQDFKGACKELKRYVELARHAADTKSIRGYSLELKKDGYCKQVDLNNPARRVSQQKDPARDTR